jgi:hypothetical protein
VFNTNCKSTCFDYELSSTKQAMGMRRIPSHAPSNQAPYLAALQSTNLRCPVPMKRHQTIYQIHRPSEQRKMLAGVDEVCTGHVCSSLASERGEAPSAAEDAHKPFLMKKTQISRFPLNYELDKWEISGSQWTYRNAKISGTSRRWYSRRIVAQYARGRFLESLKCLCQLIYLCIY